MPEALHNLNPPPPPAPTPAPAQPDAQVQPPKPANAQAEPGRLYPEPDIVLLNVAPRIDSDVPRAVPAAAGAACV